MSNTSSNPNKMSLSKNTPLTKWQKEEAWKAWEESWKAWWDARPLCGNDGSQIGWEKDLAVLREKKNWWHQTFGENYLTVEDKELEWRNHCVSVEGGDAGDEREKRAWWKRVFNEAPPLSGPQIELAREEEIAEARARNQADREKDALMGFHGPAEALAAAMRKKALAVPVPDTVAEAKEHAAAIRKHAEAMEASTVNRVAYLPRPPMPDPVLFGCPCCPFMFPSRRPCDAHIRVEHAGCTQQAAIIFHPQATEEELKACLFANLPWQDKLLLSQTLRSSDMDLCYVSKSLVLRKPDQE